MEGCCYIIQGKIQLVRQIFQCKSWFRYRSFVWLFLFGKKGFKYVTEKIWFSQVPLWAFGGKNKLDGPTNCMTQILNFLPGAVEEVHRALRVHNSKEQEMLELVVPFCSNTLLQIGYFLYGVHWRHSGFFCRLRWRDWLVGWPCLAEEVALLWQLSSNGLATPR